MIRMISIHTDSYSKAFSHLINSDKKQFTEFIVLLIVLSRPSRFVQPGYDKDGGEFHC